MKEQIKAKKQALVDIETYIKSLDPNFLSSDSRAAITKFQQHHKALKIVERDLEKPKDYSIITLICNLCRCARLCEPLESGCTNELEYMPKKNVSLIYSTANFVREEKIIDEADTALWDAFCVEGHLKMDKIDAEHAALRVQLAALQQQQNGADTVPTQSQSVEELEPLVEELGTDEPANFIGAVHSSVTSIDDSSSS